MGKPSAPPTQNMSVNGARNSPTAMGRPWSGQNMSGLDGARDSPSAVAKPIPAHNMSGLNGASDSSTGFFVNGGSGSRLYAISHPSTLCLSALTSVWMAVASEFRTLVMNTTQGSGTRLFLVLHTALHVRVPLLVLELPSPHHKLPQHFLALRSPRKFPCRCGISLLQLLPV
ncbi:hypothetical protein B0H12DRAFT_294876 [Mycena haematopus]|nr:hypothetical protein B0H12DRAFT_294876 [Mycena haematopus]